MAPIMKAWICVLRNSRTFIVNVADPRSSLLCRHCSGIVRNQNICLDPNVKEQLEKERYKHRHHPGLLKTKAVPLPEQLKNAILVLMQRYPNDSLTKHAEQLCRYLWSRNLPPEDSTVQVKALQLERAYYQKNNINLDELSDEKREEIVVKTQKKVVETLKKKTYHWSPVSFDAFKGFQYLVGRMSHDYSVLYRVLHELSQRVPDFAPENMFDFGSGVGTSMWAANAFWKKTLKEHYCVDVSADMSTIARLLLQDGEEEKDMCFQEVYFRQFLPTSHKTQYDLVMSAHTMMELPSRAERLKTYMALWRKTKDFLVLVENGTNAGFHALNEARDFILELGQEESEIRGDHSLQGHVLAPCPHDLPCPRVTRADGTPCNFDVQFSAFPHNQKNTVVSSRFCYLILRKGKRKTDEAAWPRVVREVSIPSKRVNLRTCSSVGDLEYCTITASKFGRDLYWCARNCKWGDLLPVLPQPEEVRLKSKSTRKEKITLQTLEGELQSANDVHKEPNSVDNLDSESDVEYSAKHL